LYIYILKKVKTTYRLKFLPTAGYEGSPPAALPVLQKLGQCNSAVQLGKGSAKKHDDCNKYVQLIA
jgi:hypothetical protein